MQYAAVLNLNLEQTLGSRTKLKVAFGVEQLRVATILW